MRKRKDCSLPRTSKINVRLSEQTAGGAEPQEGDNFLEFSTRLTLVLTSVGAKLHSERPRISLSLSRLRYSCIRSPTINNSLCHRCGVPPLSRKTNYFSLGWRRRIVGWLAGWLRVPRTNLKSVGFAPLRINGLIHRASHALRFLLSRWFLGAPESTENIQFAIFLQIVPKISQVGEQDEVPFWENIWDEGNYLAE